VKNRRFIFCFFVLAFCFAFENRAYGNLQEKDKGKKEQIGKSAAIRLVYNDVSNEKGEFTVIQQEGRQQDDDFLVEPKTYINIGIELLEITPSATTKISSARLRTENGKPSNYRQGNRDGSLSIRLVPSIIDSKGIELKYDFKKVPEMKEPRQGKILLQNTYSAILELFENKARQSKIAVKITPFVEVVELAKLFPREISEIQLKDSFLIQNEDKLIAKGGLSAVTHSDDIFLFFTSEGKGLFLLFFRPTEGAKPMGVVNGNILRIKIGEDTFEWQGRDPILPYGKWLVWVRNIPGVSKLTVTGNAIIGKNGLIGIGVGKEAWKRLIQNAPGVD